MHTLFETHKKEKKNVVEERHAPQTTAMQRIRLESTMCLCVLQIRPKESIMCSDFFDIVPIIL